MREVVAELKSLRLHGMAARYEEILAEGGSAIQMAEWLIRALLDAEGTDRHVRSIRDQMSAARFPVHRDLAGFDFGQSQVDEKLIGQRATSDFIDSAANLVFIGGTGTGKTHLATSLGIKAITQHGKRVRFFSTVELANSLELEKTAGQPGKLAYSLRHVDLVVLDELGYLPFSQVGGALRFHLLSKLYERTSVIITTHLTFAEGPAVFGDAKLTTALLDRLTHHCPIVETANESFRFRQSSQTAKARVKSRELSKRGKPAGADAGVEEAPAAEPF